MNFRAIVAPTTYGLAIRAMAVLLSHAIAVGDVCAADHPPISLRSDVPFTDHVHQHFRDREGLPSNWIYDLVQTRDGYVWIATHNGVARFDGLRFKIFSRSNTPQLPANDTRVLYESHDGSLWIGTVGGLARYQPGRPGTFESFEHFAGNSVHAIFEDSADNLWIGTREETWIKEPAGDFRVAENAPADVKAICQDEEGTLWFGSDTGLYWRQEATLERVDHPRLPMPTAGDGGVSPSSVNTLLADRGGVWVGFSRGLMRIEQGQFQRIGTTVGQTRLNDLVKTRDGCVYAATSSGLFRSIDGGHFKKLPSDTRARCILEDREGGLWVGHTTDRGLHYYRNSKVRTLLTDQRVNCVYEDPHGDMWFGCFTGLYRLHAGEITTYGRADGLPHVNVQTIVPADDEGLWIGTRAGLAKWSGTEFSTINTPPALSELDIHSILVDAGGVLWIAVASRGAYTLKPGTLKDGTLDKIPDLQHGVVKWFYEDSPGNLWIGHEYGLFRCEDGRIEQVGDPAFARLNNSHFTCYHAASDGTLWLGTSGGIVRYRDGRFDAVTSEDGLAADYVDRIHEDAHGNLWFAGRDGFFYVSVKELHEVASGRLERVVSHRVEPVEGVPVSSCHPKGCVAKDGTMWVVGKRGVIRVSPEPWPNPVPPAVQIERVRVDGKILAADEHGEFLSGRHRLAIDFAVPTFFNRHNVRVRYRLGGYDADWVEAGDERIAYYTDLTPGDYRFQVIAANGDTWNEEGATVRLTVQPRWWERTEARVVMAVGIVGLGLFYVRYRTRRFRQDNVVLRREIADRKRAEVEARHRQEELARVSRAASMGEMATSIAHEVKQPLFAMMTDAETAVRVLNQDSPDVEQAQDALQGITLGGKRASEIIDRIRSLVRKEAQPTKPLDLNKVARDVIAFLQPELLRRGVTVSTDLADLPQVEGNEIELQQVVLNLIMNGAQAMSATAGEVPELHVATTLDNGSIELAVRDRGVGLDESKVERLFEPFYTTKADGIGMGLAINRTIVRAHGGRIWATPNAERGATFRFQLPINGHANTGEVADGNGRQQNR